MKSIGVLKYSSLCCFLFLMAGAVFSQNRVIVPINEHLIPTENGSNEHIYNKVVSVSTQGELLEKIYNLENRPIEISKSSFKDPEGKQLLWKETQKFNELGEIDRIIIVDASSDSTKTKVFNNEKLLLELSCDEFSNCNGLFYPEDSEETIPVDRNIFEPNFSDIQGWFKFARENFKYPEIARKGKHEGTVWMGLRIGTNGELLESTGINAKELHPSLIKKVQEIIDAYHGEFSPALDKKGNPVEGWMYFNTDFYLLQTKTTRTVPKFDF
ncbi:energy transducer TonB [Cecembia calidifontis]|uniref:TonB-like protein n=1 Tax=Cecembia calidifontis TaxID=1187080 RepID=A0A4Q7P4Q6_9BACT|nr:energy transducer TonB [Cecembia calidifontis]RZS94993.1 TonB-like protein [Cecembia calidifontis]